MKANEKQAVGVRALAVGLLVALNAVLFIPNTVLAAKLTDVGVCQQCYWGDEVRGCCRVFECGGPGEVSCNCHSSPC